MTTTDRETLNVYCRSCYEWAVVGMAWRTKALADLIFEM